MKISFELGIKLNCTWTFNHLKKIYLNLWEALKPYIKPAIKSKHIPSNLVI